jgi:hypothetical protein
MANEINKTVAKVKNNPIATIVGGVATYMVLTKKFPNSKLTTNTYYMVATIATGAIVTAFLSSAYKQGNL